MIVRYLKLGDESINYGAFNKGNDSIHPIKGSVFGGDYVIEEKQIPENEYKILAPVEPSKIVAVGLNYKDHATEVNLALPSEPMLFIKPSTSVVGPDDSINYPSDTKQLEYESELGIVIMKEAKDINEMDAGDYILGYTCANDVTARDIQFSDSILTHLTRAKTFDTFCPLGPGIAQLSLNEVSNLDISLHLNKQEVQRSNTSELIFSVPFLVSYISKIMTLNPGDVIITGTPAGIGEMKHGDTATVIIENVGKLNNTVIKK